ncbi:MAG: hypothetical protein JXQ97_15810 [Natronospirillum sp.]
MDLIKLHRSQVKDLIDRRIKHLDKPFVACRILARLDYRLLASLAALEPAHTITLDALAAEKPAELFLQAFYGLQHELDATLEAIDTCIDDLDKKQQNSLIQAIQLAEVTLSADQHWLPQSQALRLLLLQHAVSLPPLVVINWLEQAEGKLAGACIQRLGQILNHEHQSLFTQHIDSACQQTRMAALQVLALHDGPQARQRLIQEPLETLQSFVPALLIACWLYPDTLFGQSPLCTALTGKPEAIPILIEQMQHAETLAEAYRAWLWLTGRTLPHYPSLHAVDSDRRHAAPGQDTVPDIAFAWRWWRQQTWLPQQRYFLGHPIEKAGLQHLAQNLSGRCLPLLAVHQQLQGLPANYRRLGFCLA